MTSLMMKVASTTADVNGFFPATSYGIFTLTSTKGGSGGTRHAALQQGFYDLSQIAQQVRLARKVAGEWILFL